MIDFKRHVRLALWAYGVVLVTAILVIAAVASKQDAIDPPNYGPTKAERLIEKHKCWTSPAHPNYVPNVVPGLAVVTLPNGLTIVDDSEAALQHVFDPNVDYGITVHAFCR